MCRSKDQRWVLSSTRSFKLNTDGGRNLNSSIACSIVVAWDEQARWM